MRTHELFSLLFAAGFTPVHAADSAVPRGVGPEYAKFYPQNPSTPFTCITNPSVILTHAQINDDYCDCPDGSDEPGTSACAYISPLSPHSPPHPNASTPSGPGHALPGFYCPNAGHKPAYIPFTYVNDGVCDSTVCCDGSDEAAHAGGVKCANRCAEIGKEWRRVDAAREASLGRARAKRVELVKAADRRRVEVEGMVRDAGVQIEKAEAEVRRLTEELVEVEKKEANRVVRGGGAGGKVGVLVGLAKGRIGELRGALGRVVRQRDGMVGRLGELEGILAAFKEEYNPNFNDEGVKRAVRAWEEYAARDKSVEGGDFVKESPEERDVLAMVEGGEAGDGIEWSDFEEGDDKSTVNDDVAALYDLTAYLPPSLHTWLSSQIAAFRNLLEVNGILAPASPSTASSATDSKPVRAAKDRLSNAQNTLTSQKTGLRNHEDDLARDHGPDDVFRTLKGQCISIDSGEYTYEVCWMDRVTQKSKKGGGQQNMGNFEGFGVEVVDEDMPADGRGLGAGERVSMRFGGGSHCWNGPNRSSTVVLGCSEDEEVVKVVEEEKCVYRVVALTPAVCAGPAGTGREDGATKMKDEL